MNNRNSPLSILNSINTMRSDLRNDKEYLRNMRNNITSTDKIRRSNHSKIISDNIKGNNQASHKQFKQQAFNKQNINDNYNNSVKIQSRKLNEKIQISQVNNPNIQSCQSQNFSTFHRKKRILSKDRVVPKYINNEMKIQKQIDQKVEDSTFYINTKKQKCQMLALKAQHRKQIFNLERTFEQKQNIIQKQYQNQKLKVQTAHNQVIDELKAYIGMLQSSQAQQSNLQQTKQIEKIQIECQTSLSLYNLSISSQCINQTIHFSHLVSIIDSLSKVKNEASPIRPEENDESLNQSKNEQVFKNQSKNQVSNKEHGNCCNENRIKYENIINKLIEQNQKLALKFQKEVCKNRRSKSFHNLGTIKIGKTYAKQQYASNRGQSRMTQVDKIKSNYQSHKTNANANKNVQNAKKYRSFEQKKGQTKNEAFNNRSRKSIIYHVQSQFSPYQLLKSRSPLRKQNHIKQPVLSKFKIKGYLAENNENRRIKTQFQEGLVPLTSVRYSVTRNQIVQFQRKQEFKFYQNQDQNRSLDGYCSEQLDTQIHDEQFKMRTIKRFDNLRSFNDEVQSQRNLQNQSQKQSLSQIPKCQGQIQQAMGDIEGLLQSDGENFEIK